MNKDLLLAILSMDSYNRNYGQGVILNKGDSRTNQREAGRRLGNATILNVDIPAGSVAAGFYAIAYDASAYGLGTVIAYRGTDDIRKDFWSYGTGAGNPLDLLAENYNATVGLTHS